jgi:hypothetical protein
MQEKQAKAQSGGANLDTKTRKKEKKKEERPWEQRRKTKCQSYQMEKGPIMGTGKRERKSKAKYLQSKITKAKEKGKSKRLI